MSVADLDPKLYANGIIVTSKIKIKEGKAEEFEEMIKGSKAYIASGGEPETLVYKIARNGNNFVSWEQYASLKGIDQHLKANPALKDFMANRDEFVESMDFDFWPVHELSA